MTQWINVLWNSGFVNPLRLPILCKKIGAQAIVKPGVMAGWQVGYLAYENVVK